MSGLAFQKLNGEGTKAYDQIQKLQELINETAKLNFPDVWKEAKMFAGDRVLIPVSKTWVYTQEENDNRAIDFQGRYYGRFTICQNLTTQAKNGGSLCSTLQLYDGLEVVLRRTISNFEDDAYSQTNDTYCLQGFATSSRFLKTGGGKTMEGSVTISFIGFQLGEAVPAPDAPTLDVFLNGLMYEEYEISFGNDYSYQTLKPTMLFEGGLYYLRKKEQFRTLYGGLSLGTIENQFQNQKGKGNEELMSGYYSPNPEMRWALSLQRYYAGQAWHVTNNVESLAGKSVCFSANGGIDFTLPETYGNIGMISNFYACYVDADLNEYMIFKPAESWGENIQIEINGTKYNSKDITPIRRVINENTGYPEQFWVTITQI
ncbi:hypothetical protein B0I27_109112 [Arcticibacter pallidicorallinus]|uniref:Uncharacterized protein n=1 Tax=Arcticibacter pallidicorallinus TaxID=1259464 RepID=A0A2T0TXK9_9SPHI|nr:hypothetical protein [Arcticibacter pallidicorallinus]PRY50389.1 hypothetical protein B0I27_109112 [Arcticibacter pallidicorallinus]